MWFSRTLHLHSACCWFCLLLLSSPLSTSCPDDITSCVELEGSPLGHLVQERRSGRLFVGGVNVLYQLSPQLEVLGRSRTGPKMDAQDCLPPIVLQDCPSARMTDNHNKILLLEETEGPEGPEEAEGPQGPEGPGGPEDVEGAQEGGLIVCGSVFQGICERRSMENISELLYTTPHPFDTQYVAANDPRVSTVAVIITTAGKQEVGGASQLRLMLVGRGYTSKGTGDIPPVTARRLSPVAPPRLAFSQEEELGKLVVGSYSQYNNQFVKAFKHGRHVYFLFSRRDAYHRKEYASYVSRLCASDRSFSSYVETPLRCAGGFNVATGASLAARLDTPALFVTMAAGQASTPVATGRSALCVFKMAELDAMMRKAQEVCYTQAGKGSDGQEEAYIEYGVSSTCLRLPKDSVVKYPCGGEHTPSPIASARPVAATPTVTTETLLTAVTTTTEAGHTIALLGDREGNVHKAVLRSDGSAQIYSSVAVDTGSAVHADLLLDQRGEHVYVLTHSKVSKLPLALCERQPDCQSCLAVRDPYCGWCVLEGRCSRKQQCQHHPVANHWLWSFEPTSRCVSIQSVEPANQSRAEPTEVNMLVLQLPSILDSLSCSFGPLPPQPAIVSGTSVTCQSPPPELLPPIPAGSDHMTMGVALLFGHVTISSAHITFYDCGATGALNQSSPCASCVLSPWSCRWCPLEQRCSSQRSCKTPHIIYSQRETSSGSTSCPALFSLLGSSLVPVGFPVTLRLLARNLELFSAADFVCVVEVDGFQFHLNATLETHDVHTHTFSCSTHQFQYAVRQLERSAAVYLLSGDLRIDTVPSVSVRMYNCSAGQSDCSQCRAVPAEYGCVWCTGSSAPSCVYNQSCSGRPTYSCPPPRITEVLPVSGPLEGGILVTIHGSNLGVTYQDIEGGVSVAGRKCVVQAEGYLISTRIVCELQPSPVPGSGPVLVTVATHQTGQSAQTFTYQDPQLVALAPDKGPRSGGTRVTVQGKKLLTGQSSDVEAYVGLGRCFLVEQLNDTQLVCQTSSSPRTELVPVRVLFGKAERVLSGAEFRYLDDPVLREASPTESYYEGGRSIRVTGTNLDVVQQPLMAVWAEPVELQRVKRRRGLALLTAKHQLAFNSTAPTVSECCRVLSPEEMTCLTPRVTSNLQVKGVWFQLDNVRVDFEQIQGRPFLYFPNPELYPLSRETGSPFHFKPGGVIAVEGVQLTRAMSRQEVEVRLGDARCEVKTLDSTHLYCEPPVLQPASRGSQELPSLTVVMGNLQVDLGVVQYDTDSLLPVVPLAAQVGLGAGSAAVVLSVLVVILMYRRRSQQALRDYKKVLLQLETLEINVGDQCRKEFTDLMTEMMDQSSDVGGPFIPLLDYRSYAERVFFPGQQGAPLGRTLDVPESRRATVQQGLVQLGNLLNNRLFLIQFIHTLEAQQSFSQRDRGFVASLLTVALHDKLEYFTEVMKNLLQDLVQQYVAKNPKLMLRRTETVVEKMLTNWMSICLYSFLKEVAGEPLYMLYRAIKSQVDKAPVDAVSGRAKRTLNDSHLLREDVDYCTMTLTVLVKNGTDVQPCPVKVLDTDTITQVKDKILDQIYRGTPFSQRPSAQSLDLEWRAGQAGHLTLSDDDVTAIVAGRWKKINTLQHYKVPDGATVALIPRSQNSIGINQVFESGEKASMLEGEEEEGLRAWHLVKSEDADKRESGRAKAIPEIYLTRLLSMKGTLQKFVDDVFLSILGTKRPPPIAVRFFFDFLDDMAAKHGIEDPETVHIWKTNSLPLRFWVNILKNPQFVLDVQVSDSVDAVLSVIAQTFIDSCTTSEHKVGRDSPVNKLLYAREIPRYKQLVERYYSDIHSAASGCYQEMNSTLTELSGSFASEMNSMVALHELYKYIQKYYTQLVLCLDQDAAAHRMQLAYRLQQVAALLESKVTDL